jgi:hypothetical protein
MLSRRTPHFCIATMRWVVSYKRDNGISGGISVLVR